MNNFFNAELRSRPSILVVQYQFRTLEISNRQMQKEIEALFTLLRFPLVRRIEMILIGVLVAAELAILIVLFLRISNGICAIQKNIKDEARQLKLIWGVLDERLDHPHISLP